MLSPTAVKSMLESGTATFADIAAHFHVPLGDVYQLARSNGLEEPTLESPAMRETRELIGAVTQPSACEWERLLWDDDDGYVVNGVDTRTTTGNINANEVIRFYHGGCNCLYTNRPTDLVMAADANQTNILVSNLVPIVGEVVEERFKESPPFVVQHAYTFNIGLAFAMKLTVSTEHRFDKLLGSASNQLFIDACIERWVEPYFERMPLASILPYDLPYTAELLNVWIWRQLETKALLKGLATLKLELPGWPTVYLSKHTILFQLKQMLQRQFGRRSILPATSTPLPPNRAAQPGVIKL